MCMHAPHHSELPTASWLVFLNNKRLSTSTTTAYSHRRFFVDSKRPKYFISGIWRSAELIRSLWRVWRQVEFTFLRHLYNFSTTLLHIQPQIPLQPKGVNRDSESQQQRSTEFLYYINCATKEKQPLERYRWSGTWLKHRVCLLVSLDIKKRMCGWI